MSGIALVPDASMALTAVRRSGFDDPLLQRSPSAHACVSMQD